MEVPAIELEVERSREEDADGVAADQYGEDVLWVQRRQGLRSRCGRRFEGQVLESFGEAALLSCPHVLSEQIECEQVEGQ